MHLTDKGHVYTWGRNTYGALGRRQCDSDFLPTKVNGLENIKSIAAGAEHSMALGEGGKLFTWGWNEHGNCGNGLMEDVFHPVDISDRFPGEIEGLFQFLIKMI